MLDEFGGNLRHALAACNAEPGAVERYNGQVPYPGTQENVKRVVRYHSERARRERFKPETGDGPRVKVQAERSTRS